MSEHKEFRELVDPEVARETIDSLDIAPGTEPVALDVARGRILAERIDAIIDVPGFDRATVDGFAVRSGDVIGASEGDPVVLERIGAVHAGARPSTDVGSGEAIEISTGAVLPDGADAVVMVERTRPIDDDVAVEVAVPPGENIMAAGTDIAAGHRALGPGRKLTARDIALLAALGHEEIRVRAKPIVGVISTGDELVRPGDALDHDRGQIHDVNSHALVAAIEAAGGKPALYPHVGDDAEAMRAMLERAADECNLVCSSGSTSASAVDVIYRVVGERGEVLHHGVAVKPGKPMLIGRIGDDDSAYIGLPGFPVSALMTFRQFVAPRIRAASGIHTESAAQVDARMASEARFGEGRMRLIPVGILEDATGDMVAYPVDKGSGATTSLAHADGVVEVPADTTYVAADEPVSVNLFDPDVRPPSILAVGEDDSVFADLLDHVDAPRFLPVGTSEGQRRYERGVPDVTVLAGVLDDPVDGTLVGEWERTWGIVLPPDNPNDIVHVEDIIDRNITVAGLANSALSGVFDDAMAAKGSDAQVALEGFGRPGHESAARRVAGGNATAGVALERTARDLDLQFLACGTQDVRVVARPNRRTKSGVVQLESAISSVLPNLLRETPGYRGVSTEE